MSETDIRWRQRYQNFAKSLELLGSALQLPQPDVVQRAGIIQFFETTFELSWKLMKDYLEDQGYIDIRSPRDAVKRFFETGLIPEAADWLKGLEDRNLTSHTYNEATAREVENLIRQTYYPLFQQLNQVCSTL